MRAIRCLTALPLLLSPVLLSMFGFCQAARASNNPLITWAGTGPSGKETNGFTLGALFQVGSSPLNIVSLGLLDGDGPGLTHGHSVGLWTETGTLLARVDFAAGLGDFNDGGFIYKTLITPLSLQPGARYILGVNYPAGNTDRFYVNGSLDSETWSSEVTFLNGRYTAPQTGFTFPNYNVYGLSYVGANAQFAIVPEPSTMTLIVCSGSAWLLRNVRHKLNHRARA